MFSSRVNDATAVGTGLSERTRLELLKRALVDYGNAGRVDPMWEKEPTHLFYSDVFLRAYQDYARLTRQQAEGAGTLSNTGAFESVALQRDAQSLFGEPVEPAPDLLPVGAALPQHKMDGARRVAMMMRDSGLDGSATDADIVGAFNADFRERWVLDPEETFDAATGNARVLQFSNAGDLWEYLGVTEKDVARARVLVEFRAQKYLEVDPADTVASSALPFDKMVAPPVRPDTDDITQPVTSELLYRRGAFLQEQYRLDVGDIYAGAAADDDLHRATRMFQHALGEKWLHIDISAGIPFPGLNISLQWAQPGSTLRVKWAVALTDQDVNAIDADCRAKFAPDATNVFDPSYQSFQACVAAGRREAIRRTWYLPYACALYGDGYEHASLCGSVNERQVQVQAALDFSATPIDGCFAWSKDEPIARRSVGPGVYSIESGIDPERSGCARLVLAQTEIPVTGPGIMLWFELDPPAGSDEETELLGATLLRRDSLFSQSWHANLPYAGVLRSEAVGLGAPDQWVRNLASATTSIGLRRDLVPPLDNDLISANPGSLESSLQTYLAASDAAAQEAENSGNAALQQQIEIALANSAVQRALEDTALEEDRALEELCGSNDCDDEALSWRCDAISEIPNAVQEPRIDPDGSQCAQARQDALINFSTNGIGTFIDGSEVLVQCAGASIVRSLSSVRVCLPDEYWTQGLNISSPLSGTLGVQAAKAASLVRRVANVSSEVNETLAPIPTQLQARRKKLEGLSDYDAQFAVDMMQAQARALATMASASSGGIAGTGIGAGTGLGFAAAGLGLAADSLQATLRLKRGRLQYQEAVLDVRTEIDTLMSNLRRLGVQAGELDSDYKVAEAEANKLFADAKIIKARSDGLKDNILQQHVRDASFRKYALWSKTRAARFKLERAKRLSFLARRALEFRIGVDFEEDSTEYPLVGAPSTWANDLFTATTAVDVQAGPDEAQGLGGQVIAEYATRLRDMTVGYSIEVPFTASTDKAVVSLRDDLLRSRTSCLVEANSRNLLRDADTFRSRLQGGPWNIPSLRLPGQFVRDRYAESPCFNGTNVLRLEAWTTRQTVNVAVPNDGIDRRLVFGIWYRGTPSEIQLAVEQAGSAIETVTLADAVCDDFGFRGWRYCKLTTSQPLGGGATYSATVSAGAARGDTAQISQPMLALVDEAELGAPLVFEAAGSRGEVQVRDPQCGIGDGGITPVHPACEAKPTLLPPPTLRAEEFRRRWRAICADGEEAPEAVPEACSDNGGVAYVAIDFVMDYQTLYNTVGGPFAAGGFNFRHGKLAANLVGTGVRVCPPGSSPTCYTNAFVPVDIQHDGDVYITNAEGEHVGFTMNPAAVVGMKSLATERVFTTPVSSTDASLIEPYTTAGFNGRPLQGTYHMRLPITDEVVWENIEDVQLVFDYRYWSLPFWQAPEDPGI